MEIYKSVITLKKTLRPQSLNEYIGQSELKRKSECVYSCGKISK